MEVLDDLLRILYEGGDAPSVVGWSGKTSDCEYRNLREHKHFLQILQGVSLYDHTYNVLKAALEIAHEELGQRHDFLLPAIVTAALGRDIGKIASLWRSSPTRKRSHESVGEVANGPNPAVNSAQSIAQHPDRLLGAGNHPKNNCRRLLVPY